ncbi:EAL domain-containing protein [uncultured Clostridium sp.]|jgi:EAL and modified HD-GYP domain-containing signal transduction protein|uniref:EAL and HDOD domain-containing protein n=1 Tax=uncultured Clostridium sp. TaxID=59620 RepID=UPI002627CA04|nr:EAL domain-containing protein [uncultured Clostridium sp.]
MDSYIARQPIFNKNREIVAYELLFRKDQENFFKKDTVNYTEKLLSNIEKAGIDNVLESKIGFINFSEDNILENLAGSINKSKFIIEILEDVEFNEDVIRNCKELKKQGYIIAIDDLVVGKDISKVIKYIDIIKVDFILNNKHERIEIFEKYKSLEKILLAEKIETLNDYIEAVERGYDLFQGFYFSKPSLIKKI